MIPRHLEARLHAMAQWFPIVSVTGPRQSGKSTLVKSAFPDFEYTNLENPQLRKSAYDDPIGFLNSHPQPLIIDEAQNAPDIFSMLQVVSDERNTNGQYVLSGSQNFLLLKRISQSLAGRVGMVKLLPFSYSEALQHNSLLTLDEFTLSGGYPRMITESIPSDVYFSAYVDTYVERDVSDYLDVRNLAGFRKFVQLCALSASNLINYSHLAKEADISYNTAKSWLSILESSYITFQLMPYSPNERKRVTKTPKIYFYDTGLLCYFMGIRTVADLIVHPKFGAIFENLIVVETMKKYLNAAKRPELYFYRDDSKIEVDLIDLTEPSQPKLIEMKSSETYRERFAAQLEKVADILGLPQPELCVVSRVENSYASKGIQVLSAQQWLR